MQAYSAPAERLYYLDWLRVFAILIVFAVHVSMPFQSVPDVWEIQYDQTNVAFTLLPAFAYQWVMHLFFFLAGAGARFALPTRNLRQYLSERVQRLFVPLIFGVLAFTPLQHYLSIKSKAPVNATFVQFYPQIFVDCYQLTLPLLLRYGCYVKHLWFLGFLFIYAILTVPVLLWLMGDRGQSLVSRLATNSENRAALLWFVLPTALIQVTLRARFPEHYNLSDFCLWLIYFLYGFIFLADRRFTEMIARYHRLALGAGSVTFTAILLLLGPGGFAGPWELEPVFSPGYALYQVLRSLNTWLWVVFFLGIAARRYNYSNRLLVYSAEAVLPFYILHHVVVIVIAYILFAWHPALLVKFLALSASALLVTMLGYEYLVKRYNLTRFLFGMRLKS